MKSIEEVKADILSKLKGFDGFRQGVKLNSKSENFAIGVFALSLFFLFYNLVATIQGMIEFDIPMEFFMDYFLDDTDENVIFYIMTIVALIGFVVGAIAYGVFHIRKAQNYEKSYRQFLQNPVISASLLLKANHMYLIKFKSNEEAEMTIKLTETEEFINDKKIQKMMSKVTTAETLARVEKRLKKNYNLDFGKLRIVKMGAKNTIQCTDGFYEVYIEDDAKHAISINKLIEG